MIDFLRTPDSRFQNLPGYDFEPHYAEVGNPEDGLLRMHYIDQPGEGDTTNEVVVMLHGEPSWCYLYRKMVPILTKAGHRAIAPDLMGFGRSDKPTQQADYTYAGHVEWMRELLFEKLDLTGITLVCQDWGGLIGLRLVGEHPDRFRRVVAANTLLSTGKGDLAGPQFEAWLKFSQEAPELPIGGLLAGASVSGLAEGVEAAYDAPYPDESFKAGARIFPALVPVTDEDVAVPANLAAWETLEKFDKPFLTAFSDGDPMTKSNEAIFQARIPGAKNQPHTEIKNAGHFLQEEQGEEFARVIVDFMAGS